MDNETKNVLMAAQRQLLTAKPDHAARARVRTRHIIAVEGGKRGGRHAKVSAWPHLSDSLGVGADQIEQAKAELARRGVKCDFTPDGQAIITSQKHHMEVSKASGLFNGRDGFGVPDENGGYVGTGSKQIDQQRELERRLERGDMDYVERALGIHK